ncbi:MAG: hypothetical protein ACYCW6_20245 [Candidatus Xenobia bacterium]
MSDFAVCLGCNDVVLLVEKTSFCEACESIYHERCWRRQSNHCVKADCKNANPNAHLMPPSESGPRPGAVRSSLPSRVQTGRISSDSFHVLTSAGERDVPWSSVQMLGVGIIELDLTVEMPRSAMRAMLRKLMGDDSQPTPQRRNIRETYLLDVFIADQDAPLRIDSSSVNYKQILGEASYQSHRNFLKLVTRIAEYSKEARLDASCVALLSNRRSDVKRYQSIYEFEMEVTINRNRLREQTPITEVSLPTFDDKADAGAWD